MTTSFPHVLDVGTGPHARRIACLVAEGGTPGTMFLQGFKSEMEGTKGTALAEWSQRKGLACVRFDYSGHGRSSGRFEDGTIGRWLEETEAVFRTLARGPRILVGSSMGGYLALLLVRRLQAEAPAEAQRIAALVLIAPAWDMTEELMWKRFSQSQKTEIVRNGILRLPSRYGAPYPIARALIEDGRAHLLARRPWAPGRPVHILHGQLDEDVPWHHTLDLASFLQGEAVHVHPVADGDHRLSRPEDLAALLAIVEQYAVGL